MRLFMNYDEIERCKIIVPITTHDTRRLSLINPAALAALPLTNTLREPVSDFLIGALNRITSVADISTHLNTEVSTNSSTGTLRRHGGPKHFSSLLHNSSSFPYHCTDWTRGHVANESWEEFLTGEILVVDFHVTLSWRRELHGYQFVSFLLKSFNNFTN